MGRPDLRYAEVKCVDCGKEYICTPEEDYFCLAGTEDDATATNGYCWTCFMKATSMNTAQPEPPLPIGE